MKKMTDHSYESIQSALQMAVDKLKSVPEIAKEHGMGERTLYTYIQRMCTGQTIRGVHSRRGTSALFRVDEHGQVQFEVLNKTQNVPKTLLGAKASVAYRLKQKIDELEVRMYFFTKDIEQLKKELERLQME
ncbi:TPA: helix-turn-helix domain-containing protein [Pasteurella multocida]|nr:helix-turn-helix domain-containing protein [Pasteurella multocida]